MSKKLIYFLIIFEGFSLVLFEILGAKILNSFYGNSTYVWSFILSFTLTGIAIGYFVGGKLSAKNVTSRIAILLLLFSLSLLFTLAYSNYFFRYFVQQETFSGIIICCSILILPPLLFLGCLSPLFIQQLSDLEEKEQALTISSKVYALSTFAGIFGALLCGFILLDSLGITKPLYFIALCATLIGLINKMPNVIKIGAGILFFILSSVTFGKFDETESRFAKILYSQEGILGQIKVIDKPMMNSPVNGRILSINGVTQTIIYNTHDAYNTWRYPHLINYFSLFKNDQSKALLLGLGGGSIARELKSRITDLDVVEIDPRIIDLAQEYFYLDPTGINLIHDDARSYIRSSKKKYDLVVYDVLTGEIQPNYVFTKEALGELTKVLNPGAVVIINFQGIVKGGDKAFGSLYKTFASSGFKVNYFADHVKTADDVIFVLSKAELNFKDIDLKKLNKCCVMNKEFFKLYSSPFYNFVPDLRQFEILTDDRPLLEHINRENIKKWRADQNKYYFKDNLLSEISQFK